MKRTGADDHGVPMFVIVVGCGRVGSELAFRLFQAGHQVAVIDEVGTSF